jgi:hypothetical protein
MPEGSLTLKELLWGEEIADRLNAILPTAIGSSGSLAAVTRSELRPVMDEAQRALGSMLDISLGDILTSAWVTSGKLREAADPARHKPDEIIRVPLLEHTIRSKQEPVLEFTLNGHRAFSVKFTIELELRLAGVVLRVWDSRIHEIVSGSCNAVARLSVAEAKLAERTTREIMLPARIHLGSGTPIPVPQRRANVLPAKPSLNLVRA